MKVTKKTQYTAIQNIDQDEFIEFVENLGVPGKKGYRTRVLKQSPDCVQVININYFSPPVVANVCSNDWVLIDENNAIVESCSDSTFNLTYDVV